MSRLLTLIWCFSLALLPCSLTAQLESSPAFSVTPQELLKAAGAIQQDKPSTVTVMLDEHIVEFDHSRNATTTNRMIYRVNNADGVDSWSESRVRWEPWHEKRPEIRTRVITPDGAVHDLDPKTLSEQPVHEQSTIYSDDRILAAPLPAVTRGAVIEEQIITRDSSPFFSQGIVRTVYFGRYVPVLRTRLVIRHPVAIPLQHSLKLLPDAVVQTHHIGDVEEIIVENGRAEPLEQVNNAPSDVVLYPKVTFGTGKSWQEIASTYAEMAEQKMQEPLAASSVHALPVNGSLPDKVRTLVAALHKQVRYTGVEFGEAAIIPQMPSETLKRGYGDCKDKSALLVAMLRNAGIPAKLALLQTGPGEDTDPALPGMGAFDHAIVFVPGTPAIWVDATAEHNPIETLPTADQDRLALVIDRETTSLTKTPSSKSEDNLLVELRDIHLSDFGPAQISESWEPHGEIDEEYRSYYTAENRDERKKALESYVKSTYLAESLSKMEGSDGDDLLKPFHMTLEVKRARRGFTGLQDAVAVIQQAYLTDRLPSFLRQEKSKDDNEKPRTVDYVITPFATEWQYRIYPPMGFQIRNLPPDIETKIGPAVLKEHFTSDSSGMVRATLRFDTTRARFTPAEADSLRDAVVKLRDSDAIVLSFDNVGHALLAREKVAEGLAKYQEVAAQNPRSALQQARFADALLTAGLGEKARKVAQQAVKLDSNSAPAYATLGWILQHDLVGRNLKSAFDYEGSIAAYKRAVEIDGRDHEARVSLAILCEYDKWGVRYTKDARLKEAISLFQQVRKDDESKFKQYQDNVLFDLFYSGQFQTMLGEASTLSLTDARRTLIVAATAASNTVEAAEKKASELSSSDEVRSATLIGAGQLVLRIRMYDRAASLFSAGTQGASQAKISQQQIAVFSRMRRHEDVGIDEQDPASLVQRLILVWFRVDSTPADFLSVLSKNAFEGTYAESLKKASKSLPQLQTMALEAPLPPDVFLDLILSNAKVSKEGNDKDGYRLSWQSPGAATQYLYVVKENEKYKLLTTGPATDIGREVWERVSHGEIAASRIMLDFARDRQPLGGGDDPLAGNLFPRFWTKGQQADSEQMRAAALALLASDDSIGRFVADLEKLSQKVTSEPQRTNFDLALALAYQKLERWQDLKTVSQQLVRKYPQSDRALSSLVDACIHLQEWDEAQTVIHERLSTEADSPSARRLLAQVFGASGQFDKALEEFRAIYQDGRANEQDMNSFAWSALFTSSVPADSLEAVQRANTIGQDRNFAVMHTLACLYAEVGKVGESKTLLIKALEISHIPEPNSELWYGFGRLAEIYGQYDAAVAAYNRVEAPKVAIAFATYNLAQTRARALTKAHPEIARMGN